MTRLSRRFWLIPILTIFLLLLIDVVLIHRMNEIPAIYQENNSYKFPAFHTKDLDGNILTQEIFNGKFSILCLWVTQDISASHDLFQKLSAWQATSSQQMQIIGMVGDLRDTDSPERIETVRASMKNFPKEIPQLMVNDDLTGFLQRIRNAPTICFVNSQGDLVGQPVVGNELSFIQKEAERLMNADTDSFQMEMEIQLFLFQRP